MDIDRPSEKTGPGDTPLTALSTNANTTQGPAVVGSSSLPRSMPATLGLNTDQPAQGSGGSVDGVFGPVPATPAIDPIFNQTIGPASGIARDKAAEVPQPFGGLGYHAQQEHVSTTPVIQPTSSRNTDPLSGPSALSQGFHTVRTDTIHPFPGYTPAAFPPVTPSNALTLRTPGQSRASKSPLYPTTPTSVGAGGWRSRPSSTFGQEIPLILGEMRDVIGNLAASVNGLKDVVSDLQVGRNAGSRRGRGSRGRRGRGGGGVRGRNQSQSTGGPVGDDYVADDESREDEDYGEQKNYKLRVSIIVHAMW